MAYRAKVAKHRTLKISNGKEDYVLSDLMYDTKNHLQLDYYNNMI